MCGQIAIEKTGRFAAGVAFGECRTSRWRRIHSYLSRPLHGFTLVEVLVVIGVVSILLALLLPTVHSAREAARGTQCISNLRQIALGVLSYESSRGEFPSIAQRHWQTDQLSWMGSTLSFMEDTVSRNIVASLSVGGETFRTAVQTSNPVFHCPNRREAMPYPWGLPIRITGIELAAKTDYAGNGGTVRSGGRKPGGSLPVRGLPDELFKAPSANGVISERPVKLRQVTDGTSKTYLVGEKFMHPEHYTDGLDGDGGPFMLRISYPHSIVRWGDGMPGRDGDELLGSKLTFGSAHRGGWHVTFCDGAVRLLGYSISNVVHERLSSRSDGLPVSEF